MSFSWFAVHCTSMNNTNDLISADNKGYASYLMEQSVNKALPGQVCEGSVITGLWFDCQFLFRATLWLRMHRVTKVMCPPIPLARYALIQANRVTIKLALVMVE